MVDLEALRTHLDEDERLAKEALPGDWILGRTTEADWGPLADRGTGQYVADGQVWPQSVVVEGTHVCVNGPGGGMVGDMARTRYRQANATHIARHDPQRVLRWVAAARKVLAEYERAATPGNALAGEGYVGYVLGVRFAVEAIASVYGEEP